MNRQILVTGANKGIGLAVVEAILREQADCRVILGSRSMARGHGARDALLDIDATWSERLAVLELDVASDASVQGAAAQFVAAADGDTPGLYGLVNNAGQGSGTLEQVLNVNLFGIHRVGQAFAPLMPPGGRIVNITSAAGPNFVANCSPGRQLFFRDADISWEALSAFIQDSLAQWPDHFPSLGMQSNSPYGFSKACANSYTMYLAACWSGLYVNACTPGFIETDLGREFLGERSPADAGMKTPAEGARVVMQLLFGEPGGSGHYYGSDGLRSPLDRYRAPGSPAYQGTP